MTSTHTAEMYLPELPTAAKTGHIVPDLASSPLLSIGQLCDAGCGLLFSAGDVTVSFKNKIILRGTRTPLTRLWIIDIPVHSSVAQQQALSASKDPTTSPTPTDAPTENPVPPEAPMSSPSSEPTPTDEPSSEPSNTGAPRPIFTTDKIFAFPPGHVALSALAEATPNDIAAYMHGAFPPCHEALSAIAAATPADIVAFMHGSFFSPTLSALENALIHQWIHNVPGLTLDRLRKFPPHSKATVKGHLKQKQKNKQSTKKKKKSAAPSTTPSNGPNEDPSEPEMNTDTNPLPDSPSNARTHLCYAAIIDVRSPEGQIYSDQTGRLPVASIHGNNYIFVLYDYDSNHIFAEPIKSRHASLLAYAVWTRTFPCTCGIPSSPRLY